MLVTAATQIKIYHRGKKVIFTDEVVFPQIDLFPAYCQWTTDKIYQSFLKFKILWLWRFKWHDYRELIVTFTNKLRLTSQRAVFSRHFKLHTLQIYLQIPLSMLFTKSHRQTKTEWWITDKTVNFPTGWNYFTPKASTLSKIFPRDIPTQA